MSPRALAATLPKLTKAVLEKGGRDYAAIIAEWPAIVGAALAADSLPEKLARRASAERVGAAGVLTLRVTGGAAMEFQHREPQLIERINSFLGHRAVERLKLIQGPIPGRVPRRVRTVRALTPTETQALDSQLAAIEDEDLKLRLERLGRALVASREPRRRPEK
jgi:hypothetical protein